MIRSIAFRADCVGSGLGLRTGFVVGFFFADRFGFFLAMPYSSMASAGRENSNHTST